MISKIVKCLIILNIHESCAYEYIELEEVPMTDANSRGEVDHLYYRYLFIRILLKLTVNFAW